MKGLLCGGAAVWSGFCVERLVVGFRTSLFDSQTSSQVPASACSDLSSVNNATSTLQHTSHPNQQALYIGYQRFNLERQRSRRREALARMQKRSKQVKEAVAAAVAAKKAQETAAAGGSAAAAAIAEAKAESSEAASPLPFSAPPSSSSSSSSAAAADQQPSGLDEPLSPAAKVMLSDLDFRRTSGSSAVSLQDAEREADLAQIRAVLADPPAAAAAAAAAAADAGAAESSDSGAEASGSSGPEREEADARLFALLSDMMRSPEGRGVVRRFKEASGAGGGGSGSGGVISDEAYIDELLSNPETKARLVRELEARLCAMAEEAAGDEAERK